MARIKLDKKDLEKNLERALTGFALEFANKLADNAPFDHGHLRREIRKNWKVEKKAGVWVITFGFPFYAEFLERGTGIYGPTGLPIQPTTKKVLAWPAGVKYRGKYGSMHEHKGSKNWYAFKWVRGIQPQPFIRPTIHKDMLPILKRNLKRFVK